MTKERHNEKSNSIPTPHNQAKPGDFAPTVLMPGDPLRARFIAENFLDTPRLVNNVRGIQGYTGLYKGRPVSVMASGMGMPSIGIYSYELFHFYGVEQIIRVGTAGGLCEKVRVRDLVLGMTASTDSAYPTQFGLPGTVAPSADFDLLRLAAEKAEAEGASYRVGGLLSSDLFYSEDPSHSLQYAKLGVLAVEMEAAALYLNAARAGKRALAICTVSDHLVTGECTDAKERQEGFTTMMKVALETAFAADKLPKS